VFLKWMHAGCVDVHRLYGGGFAARCGGISSHDLGEEAEGGEEAMTWCCASFQDSHECRLERGLSVIAAEGLAEGDPGFFLLQGRAVAGDDPEPLTHSAPISTVFQTGIGFCPWCGVRLEAFYRDSLRALAEADRSLRIST
jgi:hypothetical protein